MCNEHPTESRTRYTYTHMHVSEEELKEFIIDSGLVAKKEIDQAAQEAAVRRQPLGDILVSRGFLTEDALRRIQSYVLGIPFVHLKGRLIESEILALIPEPIARTHNIIAFKRNEDSLEVALLDTADLSSVETVSRKTGLKILPRLTDATSIKHALLQYQKSLKETFGDVIATETGRIRILTKDNANLLGENLKKMAENLSIVRIVDTLLRHAVVQGASDIHIEPMEDQVLIRYRINNRLHDAMTLPKIAQEGIVARIKVLSNLNLDEKSQPQDGRFTMETEADRVSIRVSILPTYFGEKIVLRILRETSEGFILETLGFHGESMEHIHRSLRHTSGLILVAGPSGAGTTTTLYTLLDILNRPDVSIATIEDPIDYQLPRVNQTQTDPQTGFTLASGLRALVRQDPDIIMVGEIRDSETAAPALSAAQSGHLVLAAIHAPSAATAISHLLDLGVDPSLLATSLRLVIGQRLVRKLSENKEAYLLDAAARTEIGNTNEFLTAFKTLREEKLIKAETALDEIPFYRPIPTTESAEGYMGHVGIYETLVVSRAIQEHVLHPSTSDLIEAQAKKEGMVTMFEDGLYKAACGVTSLEEVLRAVAE